MTLQDELAACRHNTWLYKPKHFKVDDMGDVSPTLTFNHGVTTVCFDTWQDLEALRNVLTDAIDAHIQAEANRQAAADIDDDSASRNGDRNHELTMAFGGVVV
jgi:hypothetical protein